MAAVATPIEVSHRQLPADASVYFEPFALPPSNQRQLGVPHAPGSVAPLALKPNKNTTIEEAVDAIKDLQKNNTLTKLLSQNGVLLFRGIPVKTPSDFSKVALAFGFKPHEIIGLVVERGELAENVSPANESDRSVLIFNHNESPQVSLRLSMVRAGRCLSVGR